MLEQPFSLSVHLLQHYATQLSNERHQTLLGLCRLVRFRIINASTASSKIKIANLILQIATTTGAA